MRRDRRRVAAAPGSAASVIARTTTTRCAPAASTSSRRASSMPPMANHGRAGARAATARTRSRPGAGRPGLVGVGQHGPDAEVVDAGLVGGRGASRLRGAWSGRRSPRRRRPGAPSRPGRSSWPRCSTSAPAASATSARSFTGQQRAVPRAHLGEHLQRGELRRAASSRLVAELDDVDAARERGVQELGQVGRSDGRPCRGTGGRRRGGRGGRRRRVSAWARPYGHRRATAAAGRRLSVR